MMKNCQKFMGKVNNMNLKFWKREEPIEETAQVIELYPKFPCSSDICLVRAACTKPCKRIEMDDKKVMELFLKYDACPDCGCEKFMEGPSGGGATNVKCGGCGHWFNLGLPLFIQRIHISEGKFHK